MALRSMGCRLEIILALANVYVTCDDRDLPLWAESEASDDRRSKGGSALGFKSAWRHHSQPTPKALAKSRLQGSSKSSS